jgi:Fe-S oxidoreductase
MALVQSFEELMLSLQSQKMLPVLSVPAKTAPKTIWLHVHCHQKALAKPADSAAALRLIEGLEVRMINSGCCGMSGEFGYKHYDVSVKIANQSLLPTLQNARPEDWIVATGASCRHQIADLGSREAWHIAQVFDAVL